MHHTLDAQAIGAYLSHRTGRALEVLSARRAFPGVSRETWLVETLTKGRKHGFVLRLEHPWGTGTPATLETEYALQEALWHAGLPVAEPLWLDRDPSFADGRLHMVRALVEGSSSVPGLDLPGPRGDEVRRGVVFSHLSALAKLHNFDWEAAGVAEHLPAPASTGEALVAEFELWEARWRAGRPFPRPVVSEFLAWLRPQIPTDSPRVSLTKGNNGVGEEVFRDGRLVALSDFELAGLSDPVLDLAFSQGTLALIDSKTALDHYERESGLPVTVERLAFAQAWNRFKALACLDVYFLTPFLDGRDPRATAGSFGLVTVPRLERAMARMIGSDLACTAPQADAGAGNYL